MPSSFPGQAEDILDESEGDASTFDLCSQLSSNDTASNLPGSGRTIGLLYSRLGRALEFTIGRLAHQSGFGPKAVASRIKVEFMGWINLMGPADSEPGKERHFRRIVCWAVRDGSVRSEAQLRSDCRKLAKYATAEVWETRMEALIQIIQLVTAEPRLRAYFNTPPILLDLKNLTRSLHISSHGSAPKEDQLIKHKRAVCCATQVLLVIEDSPLNDIMEDFLQMSFIHEVLALLGIYNCKHMITELLEYCRNPCYSFMAETLKTRAAECANSFVCSLQFRFEQHGRAVYLDEIIELHHAILRFLPDGHPRRAWSLDRLAVYLRTRFERHRQTTDIDEAISQHRDALQLLPDNHPDRPWYLDDLANSLRTRFKQYGQTADIDEAIERHRTALQLLPGDHHNRLRFLAEFAISLRTRFTRHGQTADIDEAIEHHCTALQSLPKGHPERSWYLDELVISLRTRFKKRRLIADLNEVIEYYSTTLQLSF